VGTKARPNVPHRLGIRKIRMKMQRRFWNRSFRKTQVRMESAMKTP
jgi:hypothetical protein